MMHTGSEVTRQVLAIQKTLTRNGFRTLALLQERSEQLTRSFFTPKDTTDGESQQIWQGWAEAGRAGRQAVESTIDTYFDIMEGVLIPGKSRK
ncbi:MAG: hypothetical protein QNJ22_07635 [Desulfosarcinaceae bacterium]|nr:hypothetical protein [Desulfosarcinaceae bacterium]